MTTPTPILQNGTILGPGVLKGIAQLEQVLLVQSD